MRKYTPSIALALLVELNVASVNAAEEPAPASPHTITGNLGFFSDYRFRGISQTAKHPAVQGGFDYAHASGFYAGTWASNVSHYSYTDANMEWDFYGGYNYKLNDDIGLTAGGIYYFYPGGKNGVGDRFDTVEEAYGDASGPRPGRYFDDYNLNMSMERGHVDGALTIYNTRQRINGGVQIDVKQVADEFEAYRRRNADLRKQFRVDEYWDQAKSYRPTYYEARDRLMEIPAPDVTALLAKIEIAAVSLDDGHAEAMLADARRLLPQGRA